MVSLTRVIVTANRYRNTPAEACTWYSSRHCCTRTWTLCLYVTAAIAQQHTRHQLRPCRHEYRVESELQEQQYLVQQYCGHLSGASQIKRLGGRKNTSSLTYHRTAWRFRTDPTVSTTPPCKYLVQHHCLIGRGWPFDHSFFVEKVPPKHVAEPRDRPCPV